MLDEHDLPLSSLVSIKDNQRAKGYDLKYPIEPIPASQSWPWIITLKFDFNPKPQLGGSTWLRRGSRDAGVDDAGRPVTLGGDVQTREKDHFLHLLSASETGTSLPMFIRLRLTH